MPYFAIHDDSVVINVIVADTVEVARELTGMAAVETEGAPWIGWTLEDDGFRPPRPLPSWLWNGSAWTAPKPQPVGEYTWDEDALDWVPMPQPYASWTWDGSAWVSPIPHPFPDGGPAHEWNESTMSWVPLGQDVAKDDGPQT